MPSDGTTVFRLHPTINFARVGTSDDYYLSPETSAGLPTPGAGDTVGALPIKRGTENEPITSDDLRDDDGHLRRQAARYRIFAYDFEPPDAYPNGAGVEICAGSTLADGRVVKDVVWTVHLANKKANAYNVVPSAGLDAYRSQVPQLRNASVYGDVNAPNRLQQLVIDPGPRAITSSQGRVVSFDAATPASYSDGDGGISEQLEYPKSFPQDSNTRLFEPSGPLDTLGELTTDHAGRLLVLAGKGRTAAQYDEYGDPIPCTGDLNNAGWFDDAADGPVSATIVFEDGTTQEAFGAWVICGDPDIYDTEWKTSGAGPFRVKPKPLSYHAARPGTPFLSGGWIPLHDMTDGLEPGDMSKFMSIPWQTDYNSCSIHQSSINTAGQNTATGNPLTLYWSWPSQRPDAVYPATDVVNGVLPERVWSIRGPGTLTNDPKTAATFQKALQSVTHWDRIGVVLQGTAITGDHYPPDFFLEAESLLPTEGQSVNVVAEWPFNANPSPHLGWGKG